MKTWDAVIVGAGQAGLGVSYCLKQAGVEHLVLERGQIGETWLTQRWDAFKLNTPNTLNALPGWDYEGDEPDGFRSTGEFVAYLRQYTAKFALPIRTGWEVIGVERNAAGLYVISTTCDGSVQEPIVSRALVIAAGFQNAPKVPLLSAELPALVHQVHAAHYRKALDLPPGAVMIIGSGQSGCQIAEDLLTVGRTVYLCTSRIGRAPRRYRGVDTFTWLARMGFFDVTYDSLPNKAISRSPQPQVSGLGRYGHTISLQQLARQGAIILGRLEAVSADVLSLGDDAAEHVHFADAMSLQTKQNIDAYIERLGIALSPAEADPADLADPQALCVSQIRQLSLTKAQVGTIIWATGFKADMRWVHLPIWDTNGLPLYAQGIMPMPGLYLIGCPWLPNRKSALIYGVQQNAVEVCQRIREQLKGINSLNVTSFLS